MQDLEERFNRLGRWLITGLFGMEFVMGVLHAVITWPERGTYPLRVWRFFHLDREGNLPTWFSSTQFLLVALLCGLCWLGARQDIRRRNAAVWLLCAGGAVFMSLDEAGAFHEMLGTLLEDQVKSADEASWLSRLRDFPTYYWALIYAPIAVPVGAWLVRFFWRELGENRWPAIAGVFVFVLGAVGLDLLEGVYGEGDHTGIRLELSGHSFLFDIYMVEELLEMAGVTLVILALVRHGSRLVSGLRT